MERHVYNIPASCPFMDTLAIRFANSTKDKPETLSQVLFMLPNRRACQSLKEAFVRIQGESPSVLPRMIPIGDLEEDEVMFSAFNANETFTALPPEISSLERVFLLAKLIFARPFEYGLVEMTFAEALELAQGLAKLMDQVYNAQLSFDNLADIVPAQYAAHWQDTLDFLKIITHWWPKILEEKGVVDALYRRSELLKEKARIWRQTQPAQKVVAAGINAAFPALQQLMKVVAESPQGELYFCGLDKYLDEDSWSEIDENHPQYNNKCLLEVLQIKRAAVKDITAPLNASRENFAAELMRPASQTIRWQNLRQKKLDPKALKGLHILNCFDNRQEALSIAVLMRETLETPHKTAALVTTDRGLARRVASELRRWNIAIDDSAGCPLHLTPVGIFLQLITSWAKSGFSDIAQMALLKNAYVRLGMSAKNLREQIRQWEYRARLPKYDIEELQTVPEKKPYLEIFEQKTAEFKKAFTYPEMNFKTLLTLHLSLAESLAESDEASGAQNLWRGEDGRAAAKLMSDILEKADMVGDIQTNQYPAVIQTLMAMQMVRPVYGTHPRLKILGPIEARYNQYDTVIVGGLNEGTWPLSVATDPWLSRPMKKNFGLPLPEVNTGVLADDFAHLLCCPEVYLTRAQKTNGAPMDKSRWLLRMETVLKAYNVEDNALENTFCFAQGLYLDRALESIAKIKIPEPRPDVEDRPRKLSASAIEKLMHDPYEIYARKILKLRRLESLEKKLSIKEYGSFVHKVLEIFYKKHSLNFPQDAQEQLLSIGKKLLDELGVAPQIRAFWLPRFEKTVCWIVNEEKKYRDEVAYTYPELEGEMNLNLPAGEMTITARADRLDYCKDGTINIIDYKTGEPPTPKKIQTGYAPQLPIEGLIAEKGGFQLNAQKMKPKKVAGLIYWHLGKNVIKADTKNDLLEKTQERLMRLLAPFDFKETPYYARPNPKHVLEHSDYKHLARIKEWAAGEDDDRN